MTMVTGEALRSLRNHWGLTLEQLGELLNVQKSTLSRWEAGEVPSVGSKEGTQIRALLLLDKRARSGDGEAIDAIRALRKETFGIQTEWHPVLGETVLTNRIPRSFADAMAQLMDAAEQAQPAFDQATKVVRKGAVIGLGALKLAAEKMAEGAEQLKARIESLESQVHAADEAHEAAQPVAVTVEETPADEATEAKAEETSAGSAQ